MGFVSLALAVLSFACAGLGFITVPVPWLGFAFSMGAPVLALVGILLGGIAMSRRKRAGQPTDLAKLGVILNCIAFVPGLLIAVTCGLCNAVFSSGDVRMQRSVQWRIGQDLGPNDGGVPALPPPARVGQDGGQPAPLEPPTNTTPRRPDAPAKTQPVPRPSPGTAPDRGMPPPPLPAGPRSGAGN